MEIDLEIESTSIDSPIKIVKPRKSDNKLPLNISDAPLSPTAHTRPAAKLASEGSAFRRIDSPLTVKTPQRSNGNNGRTDTLSPGIAISPSYAAQINRSTVGKEMKNKSIYNDNTSFLGDAFAPFSGGENTFYRSDNYFNSSESISPTGLSSNQSASPDILGMVHQLVQKNNNFQQVLSSTESLFSHFSDNDGSISGRYSGDDGEDFHGALSSSYSSLQSLGDIHSLRLNDETNSLHGSKELEAGFSNFNYNTGDASISYDHSRSRRRPLQFTDLDNMHPSNSANSLGSFHAPGMVDRSYGLNPHKQVQPHAHPLPYSSNVQTSAYESHYSQDPHHYAPNEYQQVQQQQHPGFSAYNKQYIPGQQQYMHDNRQYSRYPMANPNQSHPGLYGDSNSNINSYYQNMRGNDRYNEQGRVPANNYNMQNVPAIDHRYMSNNEGAYNQMPRANALPLSLNAPRGNAPYTNTSHGHGYEYDARLRNEASHQSYDYGNQMNSTGYQQSHAQSPTRSVNSTGMMMQPSAQQPVHYQNYLPNPLEAAPSAYYPNPNDSRHQAYPHPGSQKIRPMNVPDDVNYSSNVSSQANRSTMAFTSQNASQKGYTYPSSQQLPPPSQQQQLQYGAQATTAISSANEQVHAHEPRSARYTIPAQRRAQSSETLNSQGTNKSDNRSGSHNAGAPVRGQSYTTLSTDNTFRSYGVAPPRVQPSSLNQTRQELVESPHSKSKYKEFYRELRNKERESLEAATLYAEQSLQYMPEKMKWRVYLELADLAKRSNDFDKARQLYEEVCRHQPLASQGWLEWSKMEEESGRVKNSLKILREGLKHCHFHEGLLTKAVKQQEKLHDIKAAREMLSVLKYESIDKAWKGVLEGALLEARVGKSGVARQFFKYLMENVSWYGPIYHEAYRLEEKDGNERQALEIIKRGLSQLPRYGPLWFGLMRIIERQDVRVEKKYWFLGRMPLMTKLREETKNAVRNISKELIWKVYFELSQAEERAAEAAALGLHYLSSLSLYQARNKMYASARVVLVKSLLGCPANLRWKIWLAGSRLELSAGSLHKARLLLCRAYAEVPHKSKSYVYLECSRVEEYAGNIAGARRILHRAKEEGKGEWKVFLEMALLEIRCGNKRGAVKAANEALKLHSGTGRLWAILIQICHRLEKVIKPSLFATSEDAQDADDLSFTSETFNEDDSFDDSYPVQTKHDVLFRALEEVPKSGEVWCEGARCHLNPLDIVSFDLSKAQRYLCFAIQFTPQYGDTFVEYLRLEMLCQVLLPRVLAVLGLPVVPFIKRYLSEDCEADVVEMLGGYESLQSLCCADPISVPATPFDRQKRRKIIVGIERMEFDMGSMLPYYKATNKKLLQRRCINADPNYGTLWFFCRPKPFDIPSKILKSALELLTHDLIAAQKLYVRAIFHYVMKCISKVYKEEFTRENTEKNVSSHVSSSSAISSSSVDSADPHGRASDSKATDSLNYSMESRVSVSSNSSSSSGNSIFYRSNIKNLNQSLDSEGDSDMRMLLEVQEDGKDQSSREDELINDFELSKSMLGNWPCILDVQSVALANVDGTLFASTDFVSSLIQLNRLIDNRNLNEEDRRKVLFGSDMIIP